MGMVMSCLPALPCLASPCMALTSRRALKAWHYLVCVANYCCLPAPGVNLYKHTHRQHVWGAQLHGEPFRIAVAASAASASPSAGGSAWQWFSYVGRPVYPTCLFPACRISLQLLTVDATGRLLRKRKCTPASGAREHRAPARVSRDFRRVSASSCSPIYLPMLCF